MSDLPTRGYADCLFGQIHYRDTGAPGTPLVLCPQAPMTSTQFNRVYPLFAAAGLRAIGIDTPGFGMSDAPARPTTVQDYASTIPAVLDHLGIAAAHFCGHHTGAMIVTEAANTHPARALSLVLGGPAPLTREERQEYRKTIVAREKSYAPKSDGSHLSDMFVRRLPWIEDLPDNLELCTHYILQALGGMAPFWYGHSAAFDYDHEAAMRKLTQPTLVLINSGDMLYSMATRTMELFPHFGYAELQGGGVDIVDQDPVGWSNAVIEFVSANAEAGNMR